MHFLPPFFFPPHNNSLSSPPTSSAVSCPQISRNTVSLECCLTRERTPYQEPWIIWPSPHPSTERATCKIRRKKKDFFLERELISFHTHMQVSPSHSLSGWRLSPRGIPLFFAASEPSVGARENKEQRRRSISRLKNVFISRFRIYDLLLWLGRISNRDLELNSRVTSRYFDVCVGKKKFFYLELTHRRLE